MSHKNILTYMTFSFVIFVFVFVCFFFLFKTCTVGLYVSLCLMIFLCPFLHCKALRTAMYKRYINSIIIIIIIIITYNLGRQSLSGMFHLVYFVKWWQIFLELNSKRLYQSSGNEKESRCLVFTSSTKRKIRQRRQRNVQKSVMHVQSCCFSPPSPM